MPSTKIKIALAAGGAVIVVGGGLLFAQHKASSTAKDQIDAFLIRTNLTEAVSYQDISASLFGSATLRGVTIKSPDGSVAIDKVTISDVETKADRLRGIRIELAGANLPLLDMARRERQPDAATVEAIGLGYQTVVADLSVAFRYRDDKSELTLETAGTAQDAGAWTAKLRLAGIDPATMDMVADLPAKMKDQGDAALFGVMAQAGQSLGRLALAELDLGIDNSGQAKREREIPDVALPEDKPALAADIDEKDLVKAGLTPSDAAALHKTVQDWVQKGGKLRMASHLEQPLPLFRNGNIMQPAITSFGGFLVATKSKITS